MTANYQSLFGEDPEETERKIEAVQQSLREVVPRPYQREAVEAVFREWQSNSATMLVLATGLGKSVCFSEVMRQFVESNR